MKTLCAILLTLASTPVFAQTTVPDGFTFAAAGDLIGPYAAFNVESTPGIPALAALFRQADLGFANQEGAIFDPATFHGAAAAENGGGTPIYAPPVAKDLKSMGITIVSKANNHATDWGAAGLEASLASLKAAGIASAGAGMSLAEARAPAYIDTPHGKAALVDTASTFPPMSAASAPFPYRGVTMAPRPGISPLNVRLVRLITPEDLNTLKKIAGASAYPVPNHPDEARIGDVLYRASSTPGQTWEMKPTDEQAILASIAEARTQAAFVLFSIHAHETAGDADSGPADFQPIGLHFANEAAAPNDPRPADFEPTLFHAAIDAGADTVVRTGPHVLGPIEIYHGKPIFYSLASLFFPFGNRRTFTTAAGETLSFPDETFQSIIPVTTYKNGQISEIRLYPIAIERAPGPTLGFPHLAEPEEAQRILKRLQTISAPYGTTITLEGNTGIIHLRKSKS
jgi:poly-gamma-glutamate capsule biosynthesis protein CapA/YwtB (metallophosphatase superfamily)